MPNDVADTVDVLSKITGMRVSFRIEDNPASHTLSGRYTYRFSKMGWKFSDQHLEAVDAERNRRKSLWSVFHSNGSFLGYATVHNNGIICLK